MAQVTSPIILDSTGQQIHSDLQQIKNALTTPSTAADITFDNTGTGMQADDVQDAITELKSNLTDYLDLTKWNHIAGTVTVSTESTGFTQQNVSAIQTAKIVRIRAGRMIFTFYNDGNANWQCQSYNTKWKTASNDVYSQCYTVKCDFDNGVVGLRYEYVGSSAGSVSLTDIWYL